MGAQGRVWVVGGRVEYPGAPPDTPKSVCMSIEPGKTSWQRAPRLNWARAGHALLAKDDVLYAIGGQGDGSVPADRVGKSVEARLLNSLDLPERIYLCSGIGPEAWRSQVAAPPRPTGDPGSVRHGILYEQAMIHIKPPCIL